MTKCKMILLIILSLINCYKSLDAQDPHEILARSGQASFSCLKGLGPISVYSILLGSSKESTGWSRDKVQAMAEYILRRGGITILDDTNAPKEVTHFSFLYISVDSMEDVFYISIELKEYVYLARDKSRFHSAITWSSPSSLLPGPQRNFEGALLISLNGFIEDYFRANPKK